MKKLIVLNILCMLVFGSDAYARNWFSGKIVTKVYDQRPHRDQIDIGITPAHYGCTEITFTLGQNGQTEETLKSVHSTALAAFLSGKPVGGLWDDEAEGVNLCRGTNLLISN